VEVFDSPDGGQSALDALRERCPNDLLELSVLVPCSPKTGTWCTPTTERGQAHVVSHPDGRTGDQYYGASLVRWVAHMPTQAEEWCLETIRVYGSSDYDAISMREYAHRDNAVLLADDLRRNIQMATAEDEDEDLIPEDLDAMRNYAIAAGLREDWERANNARQRYQTGG
jgi:hypothetical protein